MMVELIRGAGSDEILIVGGAGGTLATMLWRLNKRVTIVDIDPLAFKIARRYFALPSGIRCVTRPMAFGSCAARKKPMKPL